MKAAFGRKLLWGAILLIIASLACSLPFQQSTSSPATEGATAASTTVTGPGGMVLTLEGEPLRGEAQIQLEVLGQGEADWESTPFNSASLEYQVGFGDAVQVGGITLTVPLSSPSSAALHQAAPASSAAQAYAAWTLPDQGSPSLVGVIVNEDQATFPVVGAGRYQVIQIQAWQALAELVDVKDPLSVPSYPQMTPSWCSPTALTDLAGYHEGGWPVGGLGSVWGESSNWFLAGQAGQAYNRGYFFNWLLDAAGYTVPENVRDSFINGNAEVFIWNWEGAQISPMHLEFYDMFPQLQEDYLLEQATYAAELFNFFHSYVESNLWGLNGDRRPVAWGSALAGHSRTITGSDGTSLYYNDPSSGGWNLSITWQDYFMAIIQSLFADEQEVVDTVVFQAEPRPASERRAVLWLLQKNDAEQGSIILRRGASGEAEAYWIWDGDLGHEYGYYYQDLLGELPPDETFDVKFQAFTVFDRIEYGYSIRSISDGSYSYRVQTELYTSRGGKIDIALPEQTATLGTGQIIDFYPAGTFSIVDLNEYLYYLKFTLFQGSTVQDVKYVFFWIAPNTVPRLPIGVVHTLANCRLGPGTAYPIQEILEPAQEMSLLGLSPDHDWGKFQGDLAGRRFHCWVSLSMVDAYGIETVPILEVPVLCSQYTTPQTCAQHLECSWNRLVVPGVCQEK